MRRSRSATLASLHQQPAKPTKDTTASSNRQHESLLTLGNSFRISFAAIRRAGSCGRPLFSYGCRVRGILRNNFILIAETGTGVNVKCQRLSFAGPTWAPYACEDNPRHLAIHSVSREHRERLNGHRGCVVWLTGLSGSGKSTIANLLDHKLVQAGVHSFAIDGDNVRHGLNASPAMLAPDHGEAFAKRFGLGFSAEDREENIRRIGAVADLFAHAGIIALTAFISPYRHDRDAIRKRVESSGRPGEFIEIFVDAPLDVCESRDPKGLYKKARAGEIKGFTGIDDPYEPPLRPELRLDAADRTAEELANQVLAYLRAKGKVGDPDLQRKVA